MRTILAAGCLAAATVFSGPASALTHAYVLIEAETGRGDEVMSANWGFGNCKGLVHSFRPDEIVMQVACNDAPSLTKVIAQDLPEMAGVKRATLWTVWSEP